MYVLPLALVLVQLHTQSMPDALRNFEDARARLRTGRVTCTVSGGPPGGPALVGMPTVQYTMQMARSGEVLYSYEGDQEGVHARDEFGYPMQVGHTDALIREDVAFTRNSFGGLGIAPRDTWRNGQFGQILGGYVDLRTIGMAPSWSSVAGEGVKDVLRDATKGCSSFSSQQDGTVYRITADFPDGRQLIYEIDEARGWNATRITGLSPDGPEWELVSGLREADGEWFPERTVLKMDGEARTEWRVADASFNKPDDPDGWEPSDIGFEVGLSVTVFGTPPGGKGLFWDGHEPTPYDALRARIDAGELEPGPTIRAMTAGTWRQPGAERLQQLQTSPAVLESFLSTWELYVALFVSRYELDDDQKERAYKCLHKVQERAIQYLGRARPKLKSLQEKRVAGRMTAEEAREEFSKLRQPVDDMFEKQLKPCLEKIPTRKQHAAAEEREKRLERTRGHRPGHPDPRHIHNP